ARALAVFRDSSPASVIFEADGLGFLRVPEFGVAVVAVEEPMDLGRRYLLEVLLENAGLAIRNSIMRRDMQRKERLATVGQALGFAVHDLNASLGMIEMLARFVEADPHALGPINALAQIRKAAGQARALMHDTLDLCSGSKDIAPRRVRVADELSDAISSWRMLLVERGVALALDLDDDLVAVIDPPLLERALWNLINNASEVLDGRADAVIHVSLQRSAAGLEVIVADNGPGIAADLRAKIFAPFASGKRHGTGFGLAIVKQIVDAHGGDVEVESSSRGASFRLIFPNAIRPEAAK
ncbi:MAG: HAMP domain-containing histidine kinase, partial [Myxococcales bacterium]|nr:HAMP domain-containing histidine kinase [Myxococcales bacterium]